MAVIEIATASYPVIYGRLRAMHRHTLYEILVHVGQRPDVYNIATMGELRSFVDGYQLAKHLLDTPIDEVPPLRQFTEWLVRQLGRGDTSSGWWQLIQWKDTDDQTAIAEFSRLISLFAQRIPSRIAHVEIDDTKHSPTGEFRVSYGSDSGMIDLSSHLPTCLRLIKYETDPGVYLEYHFEVDVDGPFLHEQYFDTNAEAYNEGLRDFRVTESEWEIDSDSDTNKPMRDGP